MRQMANPLLEQSLDDVPICFELGCFHNYATTQYDFLCKERAAKKADEFFSLGPEKLGVLQFGHLKV